MATKPQQKAGSRPAQAPAGKAVQKAQQKGGELVRDEDVPDYIKQNRGKGRGNEDVSTSDVVIPRVELVQALSPCLKKSDPGYIEGAEAGMLFNSVSRELYGERATVVPVLFKKQWLVWKDRDSGGGFRGAYDSLQDANKRIEEEPQKERELFESVETAQQLVLVVKGDGTTEEAVISMARTKLKISKQWNSMIRMAGGDRFSRQYDIFGAEDSTDKGDFHNFAVVPNGFPARDVYEKAEALYEAITSGQRSMNVDTSDGEDAGTSGNRGSGEY